MLLDPKITEMIIDAWNVDQSHPHRGRTERSLPPKELLKKVLDEVFMATLHDEEGQPVSFSVAIMSSEEIAKADSPLFISPLRFEAETLFTSERLAKIAPAFDPGLSTIVVRWESNTQELYFWGVWLHGAGTNRFSQNPMFIEGIGGNSPDFITFSSRGRAAIAVSRSYSHIGTLQAGYFSPAEPSPFVSRSLGGYLYRQVEKSSAFNDFGMEYWHFLRDSIAVLLSEASRRGHGGTIVFIPPEAESPSFPFNAKYKMDGSYKFAAMARDYFERSKESIPSSIAIHRYMFEAIQRIAQLSAVDGALILNLDFEVLAFGATLTAPQATAKLIAGPDAWGTQRFQEFDLHRYGTRHRSAMNFAAAVPESIIFVISQDGPIRAFRCADATTVYVWPDCTTSMFTK